jgi:hypothetical protein
MIHRSLGLVVAGALMLMATPSAAQQGLPVIRAGENVTGSLGDEHPVLERNGPFQAYRFEADAGMVYRITMRSADVDAYLLVLRPVGGITESIVEDDDGGGGTDARVIFYPPAPGEYVIVATSFPESSGGHGSFSLSLEVMPEEPVVGTTIEVGRTVEGALDDRTAHADPDGFLYDDYSFGSSAGRVLWIDLVSDDFDAYLSLGVVESGRYSELDADDDGGEGLNSRLTFMVPSDGDYLLRVTSADPGETGRYALTVEEVVGREDEPETRPIAAGQSVSASLTRNDALLSTGEFHHHWTYTGTAGENLVITMRSDDFDTYLYFGTLDGGQYVEMETDDDGGGGTDSQISITLPRAGEYLIRASSFGRWATGDYTLLVTSSRTGDRAD